MSLDKRLVNAKEAAGYCGLSVKGFHAWIKRCGLRIKVKNSNLYDIKALDIALDHLSGISSKPVIEEGAAYFQRELRKANKNVLLATRHKQGRALSL